MDKKETKAHVNGIDVVITERDGYYPFISGTHSGRYFEVPWIDTHFKTLESVVAYAQGVVDQRIHEDTHNQPKSFGEAMERWVPPVGPVLRPSVEAEEK